MKTDADESSEHGSEPSTGAVSTKPDLLSKSLAHLCLLIALVSMAGVAYSLIASTPQALMAQAGIAGAAAVQASASKWQQLTASVLLMLPVICAAYGLLQARRCFLGFARGEYFVLDTVSHLRGTAAGFFAAAAAAIIVPALAAWVLLQGSSAPGHLSVGASTTQLYTLLFAGGVWQIARVMAKARALAEENALFI